MYDLIVIGGGPAGMTAALYAKRANKQVVLLEREFCGGQITKAREVENYPGIAHINGMDLAESMQAQLRELQVEVRLTEAKALSACSDGYTVETDSGSVTARAVILATGLRHNMLSVPGEKEYVGRGVSFCAVCDGAFFRNREVAVVGGGNTALQDALYLSELCKKVYLIHRRASFRAERQLLLRAEATENIIFLTDTEVREIGGAQSVQYLILEHTVTGEREQLPINGIFEAIGQIPQNRAFSESVPLDADGYFCAGEDCKTDRKGIFVAGDCRKKEVRQLTTAVADGTVAALSALSYLDSFESEIRQK